MSIEKYTTEAFILREYEQGENDIVYKIWTRDFGIVFVLGKSIRKINSKLHLVMKKNDFLNVTLVKGKDVWRLTGAEEWKQKAIYKDEDIITDYKKNILNTKKIISDVINKYLEEKKTYKKLFDKMKSIFEIEDKSFLSNINNLKILINYLVLVDTGYADAEIIGVKDIEEYKNFSIQDFYTYFILNEKEVKTHLVKVLKETMI